MRSFEDLLLLLRGDLETFRHPVLDLVERYGARYRSDALFILRKLEEFAGAAGEGLPQVLERYLHYIEGVVEERRRGWREDRRQEADHLFAVPELRRGYLQSLTLSTVLNRSRYELFLDYRRALDEQLAGRGLSILEIGAGNCLDAAYASSFGHVTAYERNAESRSWHGLLDLGGRVDLRIEEYGFDEPEAYDLVTMIELLEHLPAPADYLAGARRVLREDGLAYLTCALRMPQVDHLQDFRSLEECRTLIADSGFAIEREHCLIDTYRTFEEAERWELAEDPACAVIYCCVARKWSPRRLAEWQEDFNG